MKAPTSDFERGRKIVLGLLVLAIFLGLYAGLFTEEGSGKNIAAIVGVLLCVVGVIAAAAHYCRCPHCGKRIISGVLAVRICPKCGRDLATGERVRKQKGKR